MQFWGKIATARQDMGVTSVKDLRPTCRSFIKVLFCAKTLSGGRWTYRTLLLSRVEPYKARGQRSKHTLTIGVHFGNYQCWLHHNSKQTACIHFHPAFTLGDPVA